MSKSISGGPFEKPPVSQRVIEAVAEETGSDPTEVGPLYHVIDPDALDRLFAPTGTNGRRGGYVRFAFAGCDVTVRGDGEVAVTESDPSAEFADGAERAGVAADRDEAN